MSATRISNVWGKIFISFIVITISGNFALAKCPSADLTGDCFVDFEDFALMATQWLDEGIPTPILYGMTWVSINDDGSGMKDEYCNPIDEGGFTGEMSMYETTNGQYCEYLHAALASGDIYVGGDDIVYGSNGSNSGTDYVGQVYFYTYAKDSNSQIIYSGGTFSVRTRDGYDMSDHPVVWVSWYGAMAFASYYGWRLPTEWEWQAVADYDGSYSYGCGTTINQSKANYYDNGYANPLGLSSHPYTSPVGYYDAYGYGMCDMAGNAREWTDSCYYEDCDPDYRVLRGGYWFSIDYGCLVSHRTNSDPFDDGPYGFRVCR